MTSEREALAGAQAAVQRFVRGRTGLAGLDLEDVVQETMTRLLENRSRLEQDAWEAFAVVSARNLLLDLERKEEVRQRHGHRLYAPDLSVSAEERVLSDEEHDALRRALQTLPRQDVALLADRYGADAGSGRSIRPAAAARLSRARAKLRVAYLLQHAKVALPTERCRPVLEALSTADRRRQERLGAARHLQACRVCASHAPALVERRRALAGVHPLAWLGVVGGGAWSAVRRQPARAGAGAGVVAAAAVGALWLASPAPPPPVRIAAGSAVASSPSAADRSTLTVRGQSQLPRNGSAPLVGAARAVRVPVAEVSADEGFWVGAGPGQRLWVSLVGGGESPQRVRSGDAVSFVGVAVPLPAAEVPRSGPTDLPGRQELAALAVTIQVRRQDLVVHPG